MPASILFVCFLVVALLLIFRRFVSGKRQRLNVYIRERSQEAQSRIESMRLETRRFDAHEALAPVEAGLRELLDLHGNPEDIVLDRENDALILRAPGILISVDWNFRAASRTASPRSGHIYGKGQWELRIHEDLSEPYAQLASLMGRLSAIVRALAKHEPLEDFAPDEPPSLP